MLYFLALRGEIRPWVKPHQLILVHHNYTAPETLKTHSITSVLKTTLRLLNRFMMSVSAGIMAFSAHIQKKLSTDTLTVVICTMVSPVSNVLTVGMNIYYHFPASAATFAPPAIKSEWLSLVNGYAWRF